MKKVKLFLVVMVALLMAGGLFLAGCNLTGCSAYSTCTNYYTLDCGRSSCWSYTHYGYTCDC